MLKSSGSGQPQETTFSIEAIDDKLLRNKKEFKDADSANVSFEDEDLESEIGSIDQRIEECEGG
jgi:hypothetical protein